MRRGALVIVIVIALVVAPTTAALPDAPGARAAPAELRAVAPETDRKSITAVRIDRPPRIDGRLDDPAWAAAPPDDRFTQSFPAEGKPPTERTELRVLYDDEAIYVGVRLHDAHPRRIVARLTRRDRIPEADAVTVRIDSRHDHASAYAFRLHASGVQVDNLLYDDGNGSSPEWDAIWAGEVSIDDQGWTAEYRIPLSALRFAGLPQETWGLQVQRYVSRTGELDVWSYWPSSLRGEVSHYHHMTGLADLRTRRVFDLRPYVLGRLRGTTSDEVSWLGLGHPYQPAWDYQAGLDLKLGLTSDLTLDLSANPDFGQVEADQVVLNLSRFESFFPEKRPFFLEGTDLLRTPIQLFYSRRIGRPPTGLRVGRIFTAGGESLKVEAAPASLRILGAGKLSGQLGRNLSVGMLAALTDAETVTAIAQGARRQVRLAPRRGYNVLRTRYGLGGPSYLGLMATGVSRLDGQLLRAADDHDAYAGGLDGQWQSPGADWRIGGQALFTSRVGGTSHATATGAPCPDPAVDGTCVPIIRSDGTRLLPGALGYGGTLRASHAGTYDFQEATLDLLSPELDPNDAGFLPDYNKQQATVKTGFQDKRPGMVFQNVSASLSQTAAYDFSGTRLATRTGFDLSALFRNFSFISPGVGYWWPDTWDTRETLDGGRFENRPRVEAYVYVASDGRSSMMSDLSVTYARTLAEGTYSFSASGSLVLRPLSQLEVTFSPGLAWDARAIRFYQCRDDADAACTIDSRARHYHFAALDSGSLSFVLRATWALSPRLSLQIYGQLFMAQGAYSDYRAVDAGGPGPFIRWEDLRASAAFRGDNDGDGIKDDDFEQASLNGNVVLRWEPWPGSALFAVYTRAQQASPTLAGRAPGFRANGLLAGPTEDIAALKLVFYWGR